MAQAADKVTTRPTATLTKRVLFISLVLCPRRGRLAMPVFSLSAWPSGRLASLAGPRSLA